MIEAPPPPALPATSPDLRETPALERVARELETAFLAEMLTHAGLGRPPEGFGGGAGEAAFASLLVREQARLLSESGGVGLAEAIVRALAARGNG